MNPKMHVAKSGASVSMVKSHPSGMYELVLRSAAGGVIDKVRCDTWDVALEYWQAFKKQADAQ